MWSYLIYCFVLNFLSMCTSVHTGPSYCFSSMPTILHPKVLALFTSAIEKALSLRILILPPLFTPKPLPQTPALITLHKYQFPSFPLLSECLSALFFPCTCLLLTVILFIRCLYLPLEYIFQKRGKLFYLFLHSQS